MEFVVMHTIEVKGISKSYHQKKAVDTLSFTVESGHIIGLLGPNGAGKTTTMSIMTGILAPDDGEVLFDGVKLTHETEAGIKAAIGFLSEVNPLYRDMLVEEYLAYMAGLRGMEKAEAKEAINRVAKETGIADKLRQPIEELSKGYKQRVGLAQAILHDPKVLILDEPTEGLDPNQRVTIRELISRLGKDKTVVISTHVLSEVQAMCDRVIILNQGRLITEGPVQDVLRQGQEGQKVEISAIGQGIRQTLEQQGGVRIVEEKQVDGRTNITLLSGESGDIRPKIFALAKEHGWVLYELHEASVSFEDIFRSLTAS